MTTRRIFAKSALSIFIVLAVTASLRAQNQEAVAVITELKLNRGDVQIRLPGKNNSERPAVLQSLVLGAQVLASKDASVVIVFTDGSKTVTVDEKNSPFEIKAASTKAGQGRNPLAQVAGFLVGKKQPPTYAALATRGSKKAPTLLSPRNTKLMTATPNLQWMGMDQQVGTVRVYGQEGLVWSAENIALTQIKYPSVAAPLKPGVEYSWTLEKKGFAPEKANFKLIAVEEARSVQERLSSLQQNTGASATTLAIIKASFLMSNELFYDARELLVEALKSDPDEPTLHFLLGEIYDKTGLKILAGEEYGEAEFLRKGHSQ
jgi:hypothetical protein